MTTSIERVQSFDGLVVPVNVYLPAPHDPPVRHPTVVLIHGGPSFSAHMEWSPPVRALLSLGFAVVQPNIRGSTGFGIAYEQADDREKRGDALRDVGAVRDWAAHQPWCDSKRFVVMGTSYGGFMTLLALAHQPTLWAAGVDISGMSNLITMERLEDQALRVYDETEFGALGKDDALLRQWSPLEYASNIVAPLFVYQGKNDPVTPKNEADQIVEALRKRAVPVEYMVLDDEGHGTFRRTNTLALYARIARFLARELRPSGG
jgi:dipeptidyl aminopeptidase/acylaminoacyl peptidase